MHAWHGTIATNAQWTKYSERAAGAFSRDYQGVLAIGDVIRSSFPESYLPFPSSFSYQVFNKILPLWIDWVPVH